MRDATTVAGHAVRQLYLDCGAVDVATELGDRQLLDGVVRRWRDMVDTRDVPDRRARQPPSRRGVRRPFELPPDRAYAETCASIAASCSPGGCCSRPATPTTPTSSSGQPSTASCPDCRSMGRAFFYVNTLQRRTDRVAEDGRLTGRGKPWFACACCPPNVMRFLSSWQQYLATTDDDRRPDPPVRRGRDRRAGRRWHDPDLDRRAGYPWDGAVTVTIVETRRSGRGRCRCGSPPGARSATLRNGRGRRRAAADRAARQVDETRTGRPATRSPGPWTCRSGSTEPDRRIDAVRGCVALERGPLVYCVETADLPPGVTLEDVELDAATRPVTGPSPDLADGSSGCRAGRVDPGQRIAEIDLSAVPYFAWANRSVDAMRVWIPRGSGQSPVWATEPRQAPTDPTDRGSAQTARVRRSACGWTAAPSTAGSTRVGSKTRTRGSREAPRIRGRARSRARRSRGRSRRSACAGSSARAPCAQQGAGRRSRRPTVRGARPATGCTPRGGRRRRRGRSR